MTKRYPHGTVIDWNFSGIPEQFCGEGQFITVVPGAACVIEDFDHPSNEGYRRTIKSMNDVAMKLAEKRAAQ